jgi:hypothetical protein
VREVVVDELVGTWFDGGVVFGVAVEVRGGTDAKSKSKSDGIEGGKWEYVHHAHVLDELESEELLDVICEKLESKGRRETNEGDAV